MVIVICMNIPIMPSDGKTKTVMFIGAEFISAPSRESKTYRIVKLKNFSEIQIMLIEIWLIIWIQGRQRSGNSVFKQFLRQMCLAINGIFSILLKLYHNRIIPWLKLVKSLSIRILRMPLVKPNRSLSLPAILFLEWVQLLIESSKADFFHTQTPIGTD